MTSALAYMDESGDLGWKLDAPYQQGGSSRYFIVAIAVGIENKHRRFGKVMDALHAAQKWTSLKEKKWATASNQARLNFCQFAAKELSTNRQLKVMVAVCHKENAPDFMRSVDVRAMCPKASDTEIAKLETQYKGRAHLVYSLMVAETLAEHLPALDSFAYCPDELNEGARTLEHIVAYRLLFQDKRTMSLRRIDFNNTMQGGLTFADMIAGATLEAYENGNNQYLEILRPFICIKEFNADSQPDVSG